MGLFDRFLKVPPESAGDTEASLVAARQEAERLLEEGMALEDQGQLEEALARYEAAIALKPALARAHFNRGNILLDKGDAAGALAAYEQAVKYKPDSAAAHYNIGSAHLRLGNAREAIAACRQAIALKPDFADAHVSLNMALGSESQYLGKFDQAEASYRQVLKINPRLAEAHNSLGVLFSRTNRLVESIASFEQAIKIRGEYAEAHANLGGVLKDIGHLAEATKTLHRALEIDPHNVLAHNNLLFICHYVADLPAEQLLADAKRFGEVAARLARPRTHWQNPPDPQRVLRVGFVSGDLNDHPVGCFLEGVLVALTARPETRLELFAYPTFTCDDETSARLRACCKGWHSAVGLSDEALAQRITEDGIDILVDLSGHTAHNRLTMFAWKPAPVQLTWLGYLATTGLTSIDYVIADAWTLSKDEEAYFTEKVWRLPESYICFTPPVHDAPPGPLPAIGNGYVTFGSCNNLSKMNDVVVALWSRILQAVPDSRLLLKSTQLQADFVRQKVIDQFGVHGIGAERLILKAHVPRGKHLMTYCEIDIALDPFPYPGITTSVESLWMGVPVLTLAGEHFLSRQGVGLLMNAGLPEWVAKDPGDYVTRAVSHAGDLQALAALRSDLRRRVLASPIFDAPRFARHFEAALRGMWEKWCARHPGAPLQG